VEHNTPSPGTNTENGVPLDKVAVEKIVVPLDPPSRTTTVPAAEPGVTKIPLNLVRVSNTVAVELT
jgi:hypothetical protein